VPALGLCFAALAAACKAAGAREVRSLLGPRSGAASSYRPVLLHLALGDHLRAAIRRAAVARRVRRGLLIAFCPVPVTWRGLVFGRPCLLAVARRWSRPAVVSRLFPSRSCSAGKSSLALFHAHARAHLPAARNEDDAPRGLLPRINPHKKAAVAQEG